MDAACTLADDQTRCEDRDTARGGAHAAIAGESLAAPAPRRPPKPCYFLTHCKMLLPPGSRSAEQLGPRTRFEAADHRTRNACHPLRGGFYLHDSTKGFSHGCIEIEVSFFNRLYLYVPHARGKYLSLRVKYATQDTNGGTRVP